MFQLNGKIDNSNSETAQMLINGFNDRIYQITSNFYQFTYVLSFKKSVTFVIYGEIFLLSI